MRTDSNPIRAWFMQGGWTTYICILRERLTRGKFKKINLLVSKPVRLSRGSHICELCAEPPNHLIKTDLSNGIVVDPNCFFALWIGERPGNDI